MEIMFLGSNKHQHIKWTKHCSSQIDDLIVLGDKITNMGLLLARETKQVSYSEKKKHSDNCLICINMFCLSADKIYFHYAIKTIGIKSGKLFVLIVLRII